MAEHATRAHAALGASSAYRWIACPGSIRLSDGIPERESGYAKQGTAAHELAQACLQQDRRAEEFVDRTFNGFVVDAEMAEAVQVYLDHVHQIVEPGDLVLIEHKFSLEALTKGTALEGVPLFGTADLVIYKKELRWLYVRDYKHGAGVPVEVTGNPQLRYYALGAAMSLQDQGVNPILINYGIVQPRAPHYAGPVRAEDIDPLELIEWSADLLDAAERTLAPDPPMAAGNHCRFCPAAAVCPEAERNALAVAQAEFTDAGTITVPPDPAKLKPDQIGRILAAADVLENWLDAVRAHALGELEAGRAIPGWKLAAGRMGNRDWTDETDAAVGLACAGLGDDQVYVKKLISPTQAEKLIGKDGMTGLSDLIIRKPGKPTLALEHDKRPALTGGAAADFASLPNQ